VYQLNVFSLSNLSANKIQPKISLSGFTNRLCNLQIKIKRFGALPSFSNEAVVCFVPFIFIGIRFTGIISNKNRLISIYAPQAYSLPLWSLMNISDYLIIYFSIGAPFGVYTYFQTRLELNQNRSRQKALAAFFLWMPVAFRLIRAYKFFDDITSGVKYKKIPINSLSEENLPAIQKKMEKFLSVNDSQISIFEFRETSERYAGLTAALKIETTGAKEAGKYFFKAAKNNNAELAAKCFYRRNRARLFFHQTSARKDFLHTIAALFPAVSDKQRFAALTLEFTDALKDFEARAALEKFLVENSHEYENSPQKQWRKTYGNRSHADCRTTI
jgi:hypothetical protein